MLNDGAVKLQENVFSDSVVCLAQIAEHPRSLTSWKDRIEWFTQSPEYRDLDRIDGEPVVFEWKNFPGHTTLQLFQEHMREVLLNDRRDVRATREDNTRCDTFNTWMTHANTLLLLTQTAIQGCAVTSLVGTRSVSVCAVSRSVIHGVLRSQTIPQPTRLVSHVLQGTCTRPE